MSLVFQMSCESRCRIWDYCSQLLIKDCFHLVLLLMPYLLLLPMRRDTTHRIATAVILINAHVINSLESWSWFSVWITDASRSRKLDEQKIPRLLFTHKQTKKLEVQHFRAPAKNTYHMYPRDGHESQKLEQKWKWTFLSPYDLTIAALRYFRSISPKWQMFENLKFFGCFE